MANERQVETDLGLRLPDMGHLVNEEGLPVELLPFAERPTSA